MLVGLLGILKAGGAYLPLDPAYPPERLAFMLADAGARVLVTQSGLMERLPEIAAAHVHVVRLDADQASIGQQPGTAPRLNLDPQHPAYVIYTSGSTGSPKGVVVAHHNVVRLFTSTERYFRLRRGRCLDAVPFVRLRLFGLGDLGRASVRRPAGRGAL